jgi:hypothetical protein
MNDWGTDDGICDSSWFCTSGGVNVGCWKFTGFRTDGGTSTGIGAGASAGVVVVRVRSAGIGTGVIASVGIARARLRLFGAGASPGSSGAESFRLFRGFLV